MERFKEYMIIDRKDEIRNNYTLEKDTIKYQKVFKFPNGYGISVISGYGTYSEDDKPYEICVLKFVDEKTYELCYTTEISNDVVGWLTNEEVVDYAEKIKAL